MMVIFNKNNNNIIIIIITGYIVSRMSASFSGPVNLRTEKPQQHDGEPICQEPQQRDCEWAIHIQMISRHMVDSFQLLHIHT